MSDTWTSAVRAIHTHDLTHLQSVLNEYSKQHSIDELVDKYKQSLLHIAVIQSDIDIVKYLTSAHPTLIHHTDHHNRTSLHHVSNSQIAAVLIGAGVDVESQDNDGSTPLHVMARQENAQLLQYLINTHHANVHATNHKGQTILHIAAQYGYANLLKSLVQQYEFDVNQDDGAGWSPLMYSALGTWPQYESHTQCIQTLLKHSADINHHDKQGMTALHVCTDSPAVRMLLLDHADPYVVNHQQHTPLFYTNAENTVLLLEHISKTGSDDDVKQYVQHRDVHNRTVLHTITDIDKILVLQRYGIDVNAIDKYGKTPLDYAIQTDRDKVEAKLRQLGGVSAAHISHTTGTTAMSRYLMFGVAALCGLLVARLISRPTKQPS